MSKLKEYSLSLLLYSMLVILVFFGLFDNKQLFINDLSMSGMEPFAHKYEKVESGNHYNRDIYLQFVPYRYLMQKSWKEGNFAFWNPNKSGGLPQYSITYATNFNITNILYLFLPFYYAWHAQAILLCVISALCFYIFARFLGLRKRSSFIGGLAFALNSMFVTYLLYFYIIGAFCWLPLILLFYERYVRTKNKSNIIYSAIFLGLAYLGGFIQALFLLLFLFFLYVIFREYNNRRELLLGLKTLIYIGFISFLLTLFMWLPTFEYFYLDITKGSSKFISSLYRFSYIDNPLSSIFTVSFAFPEVLGDFRGFDLRRIMNVSVNDFHAYIGLPLFILFIYGITKRKEFKIRNWIVIGLVSLVIPLFTPLYDYLYYRVFMLFIISAVFIGTYGLNSLLSDKFYFVEHGRKNRLLTIAKVFFYLYCLIIAVFILTTIIFTIYEKPVSDILRSKLFGNSKQILLSNRTWYEDRIELTLNAFKLSNINIIIAVILNLTAIISIIAFAKRKITSSSLAYIVFFVTYIQVGIYFHYFNPFLDDSKYPLKANNGLIEFLQKNAGYERVSVVKDVVVYNKIFPANLQDLYDIQMVDSFEGLLPNSFNDFLAFQEKNYSNPELLGLLNTRYIIADTSDKLDQTLVKPVYFEKNNVVYENLMKRDRAELFSSIKHGTISSIYNRILNNDVPADTLLVENNAPVINGNAVIDKNRNRVKIVSYSSNKVSLYSENQDSCYLKLADVYYPGWEVYVNNNKSKIYKAYGCMRAVLLPPGKNYIEFVFHPATFYLGLYISLGFFAICIVYAFALNKRRPERINEMD